MTVVDEERVVGLAVTPTDESTPLLPSTTSARIQSIVGYLPAFMRPKQPSQQLAPKRLHNFVQNEECSICLEGWEDGDRVIELPCGHLFHEEEIRAWLLESKRLVSLLLLIPINSDAYFFFLNPVPGLSSVNHSR